MDGDNDIIRLKISPQIDACIGRIFHDFNKTKFRIKLMHISIGGVDAHVNTKRTVRTKCGQENGDQALGQRRITIVMLFQNATRHNRWMRIEHLLGIVKFKIVKMNDGVLGRGRKIGRIEQWHWIFCAHFGQPAHLLILIELFGVQCGARVSNQLIVCVVQNHTQFRINCDKWTDQTIGRNWL